MQKSGAKAYLVNTGWNGSGKRISIKDTRGIIAAILNGDINNVPSMKEMQLVRHWFLLVLSYNFPVSGKFDMQKEHPMWMLFLLFIKTKTQCCRFC